MRAAESVTMAPFSRSDLTAGLRELAAELRRNGVKAHLYIVGAAAMSLAFDGRRVTPDIDTLILDGQGPLIDAAHRIARRRGWPPSWLYEQAVLAIPKKPDHRARPVYGDANLVVTSASAVHLLAMKVRAGRIKDMDDITFLVGHLGLRSAGEVLDLHDRVFPGRSLSERAFVNVRGHLAGLWPTDRSLDGRDACGDLPGKPGGPSP